MEIDRVLALIPLSTAGHMVDMPAHVVLNSYYAGTGRLTPVTQLLPRCSNISRLIGHADFLPAGSKWRVDLVCKSSTDVSVSYYCAA